MIDEYEMNEEDYYAQFTEEMSVIKTELPAIMKAWANTATSYSKYNDTPASLMFFNLLSSVCKDFVHIPDGDLSDDIRIHLCWIQTSGTGKSTMWRFVGPIAKSLYKKINETGKHPPTLISNGQIMDTNFDIFSLVDYTDAALIGYMDKKLIKNDEDAELHGGEIGDAYFERVAGALEGSGLAHWDEFEYSGVFKESQHKSSSIVYLNTLMNSLTGESWEITKQLKEGGQITCYCQRTVVSMTYPPRNLQEIMATTGVLPRMVMYVHDVPSFIQDKIRRELIGQFGIITERKEPPTERFANNLFEIYNLVKERFVEVGCDPLKTMTYTQDARDRLLYEYDKMDRYIKDARQEVKEILDVFITRLNQNLKKMAVLCSIAQSRSIKDKDKRFIVTGKNVEQAGQIAEKCYITLVAWLERSLRVRRTSVTEKSMLSTFKTVYVAMEKDEDGFISKKDFLSEVKRESKKSQASVYNYFKSIENLFEIEKQGRAVFIKFKGEEKK
tara:strand:- start:860 stop:2359 length:1500 start_codon:yes stop_codon:yes gene_type:complete